MDVAGRKSDSVAVTQGQLLGEHHYWIAELEWGLKQLATAILQSLRNQVAPAKPCWSCPDKYDGDPTLCKGYILQSSLFLTSLGN